MKKQKILFLLILSLFFIFTVSGFEFYNINLSNDDRLLFGAEFESQRTLFVSSLNDMSIRQLTAFPERLQIVDNGRSIIAVNRFGASRITTAGGLPTPLPVYPSFAEKSVPLRGRTQDLAVSSNGRWMLYVEPTTPAYGNLFLVDLSSGARWTISQRVELPASEFPAKWSPDSRLFVYSKGGRLYYFPIVQNLSVLVDERFRMMGSGGISSVSWGQHGDFYYFTRNTLYRIRNPELFTRTIYGDFLSIGTVEAVFPFDFDSNFDRYWIAPDSGSVLVSKNGKGLFVFLLGENRNSNTVLPHVSLPAGAENINVFWAASGRLTFVCQLQGQVIVRRFEINRDQVTALTPQGVPLSSAGALSPDGSRIVFWGENGIELWDFAAWQPIQRLTQRPTLTCVWLNNDRLITGNSRYIEELHLSPQGINTRRICLAGADEFGFEAGSRGASRILVRAGTNWYVTDGNTPWTPAENPQLRDVSLATDRFRVYLETQSAGHFKNIPMIRNVHHVGTHSFVAGHSINRAFTLGRQQQIALCFDLYDDDSGLFQILAALRRRGIRATFFLNGDFIRRYPLAARAIAEAGHETASLFYAPVDFSDTRYRITREFITQGLARNEDEFFNATNGRELSLLWHPPFYRSSALVNAAAAEAGYTTVTRSFDPGDWVSREDVLRLNLHQVSPSEIIEQIIQRKTPGAVIPVRLGVLPGGRDEYLFQRIDVLLDALIRSGCVIVPVSAVIGR